MLKWILALSCSLSCASWAAEPTPLFMKLLKPIKKARAPAKIHWARDVVISPEGEALRVVLPTPTPTEDLGQYFIPTLTDDLKNYMALKNEFEANLHRLGHWENSNQNYPQPSAAQREQFQDGLIKNYLENQLLKNFLVKKLTASSETIQSVESVAQEVAANTDFHVPVSEEQGTAFGSDTNFWKRRARVWLTTPLVDGEAYVRASKIINPEYRLRFYKTVETRALGLQRIHGEFNYEKTTINSLFRTDFTPEFNFSYQREMTNHTDLFQFSYSKTF